MRKPSQVTYQFADVIVIPHKRRIERPGGTYQLKPQGAALLTELLEHPNEVVSYERLLSVIAPESLTVTNHQLHVLKNGMADALGAQAYVCIEAVPGEGYRLNAEVTKDVIKSTTADTPLEPSNESSNLADRYDHAGGDQERDTVPLLSQTAGVGSVQISHSSASFSRHLVHLYSSCFIYALLYAVALSLEVAYQFDILGKVALKTAPLLFIWIFSTSVLTLISERKRLLKGKGQTPIVCALIFIAAALATYSVAGRVLPVAPVTKASFQTFTAQGAYLKSICYFMPLALVYLIFPLHTVTALEHEVLSGRSRSVLSVLSGNRKGASPSGTIYIKPLWLGLLLFAVFILALAMGAHLFDNLQAGGRMNLFMNLALLRFGLYFGFALECVMWYSYALNEIKLRCLDLSRPVAEA